MSRMLSPGNMKLGKMDNFNLPPILTCPNHRHCMRQCYALKAFRAYPGVQAKWQDNYARLEHYSGRMQLRREVKESKSKYIRIHVAGDFMHQLYFELWKEIAIKNPDKVFLAFSKAFNIRIGRLPKNFKLRTSIFQGQLVSGIPESWSRLPRFYTGKGFVGTRHKNAKDCAGSCIDCKTCFESDKDVKSGIH